MKGGLAVCVNALVLIFNVAIVRGCRLKVCIILKITTCIILSLIVTMDFLILILIYFMGLLEERLMERFTDSEGALVLERLWVALFCYLLKDFAREKK